MGKLRIYNKSKALKKYKGIYRFLDIEEKKQSEIISAEKRLWLNIFNRILEEKGIEKNIVKIGYKIKKYIPVEQSTYIMNSSDPFDFARRIKIMGISPHSPKSILSFDSRKEIMEEFLKRIKEIYEVML